MARSFASSRTHLRSRSHSPGAFLNDFTGSGDSLYATHISKPLKFPDFKSSQPMRGLEPTIIPVQLVVFALERGCCRVMLMSRAPNAIHWQSLPYAALCSDSSLVEEVCIPASYQFMRMAIGLVMKCDYLHHLRWVEVLFSPISVCL